MGGAISDSCDTVHCDPYSLKIAVEVNGVSARQPKLAG